MRPTSRNRSAASGLDSLFRPGAVAALGASVRTGAIGWQVVHKLVSGGFEGKVVPVPPHAGVLHSTKCCRSVLAIADQVDLVVMTMPKQGVPPALVESAKKGVR